MAMLPGQERVVIPLNFSFAADNGQGFGGNQVASAASNSPIFRPTALPSGETAQYLNAVMRSEFNKIGTGYGVQLAETMLPTQTITVPRQPGAIYNLANSAGQVVATVGLVNGDWFNGQLQSILVSAHLSPTTLPIVI